MANQIPPSDASLSNIDINDKRYPRPKWLAILRSLGTPDNNGKSPPKFIVAMLIFMIEACFIEIFGFTSNFNSPGFIIVIIVAVLSIVPSIKLSFFLVEWAPTDKQRETALLSEREWKRREELEKLPLPVGFKLRHKLIGHADWVQGLAWSLNGETLASWSGDGTVRLWNTQRRQLLNALAGVALVSGVAWSPNGKILATGSNNRLASVPASVQDHTVRLWNARTSELLHIFRGHSAWIQTVAWSPDGEMLASGSNDKTVRLWNVESDQAIRTLTGHSGRVGSVAWSPDGEMLASGSNDKTVRLWNVESGQLIKTLTGHSGKVGSVVWSPDGEMLASGSNDKTVRLWNAQTGQHIRTLEGHTGEVSSLSFSFDGRLLVSNSNDGTVRLWRSDTWAMVTVLNCLPSVESNSPIYRDVAFHPSAPILATGGVTHNLIHILELDIGTILKTPSTSPSISYTNTKVVLVGDSGVGKSGLGLVISKQKYQRTDSTHGRHIWTFVSGEAELDDGRKETREILLWDLAGQPGYRLIHQLHLNEVAVALIVFDARSETDPFVGVQYWDRALRQAQRIESSSAHPLKKFLVSARADRGAIGVSSERIKALIQEMGFDGYFETSAKEGWQIPELQEAIQKAIDWEVLPKVSSTKLFQQIKAFLVRQKEAGRLLSTADDLYRTFLASQDAPSDTGELRVQFETCIGRVESVGLIKRLSFGKLVLLQPELLDAYASALVNAVKDEPEGLGSIMEERVRKRDFRMPGDERIKDRDQEKLLLIAMVEDLLSRELALREEAFLIFPSQSTRENPDLPDPEGKAITFDFEGPVLNIYTTLAVRLSNSEMFKKKALWKNAITYTANVGGSCGMFLRNIEEGRGELTLFFDKTASEETKLNFENYIYVHLQRRALPESLRRRRILACDQCGVIVTDQVIQLRRERNFNWLNCSVCGNHISLLDREERLVTALSSSVLEMDRAADGQREREVAKTAVQGKKEVKDFDVFLCHHNIDKPAVKQIGEQLKECGILPWLDEWELRPGFPWQQVLEEQVEHIKAAAVFIGENGRGPWQDMELSAFIRQFVKRKCPVIPVILPDCNVVPSLPPFLEGMTWVDFRKQDSDPMERLIWGITGERREGH